MEAENARTIRAIFNTREAADRAVEHLVQEFGMARADIFVEAREDENSAGTSASGGDAARDPDEGSALEPALEGRIEVSADVSQDKITEAEKAFRQTGAIDIQKG